MNDGVLVPASLREVGVAIRDEARDKLLLYVAGAAFTDGDGVTVAPKGDGVRVSLNDGSSTYVYDVSASGKDGIRIDDLADKVYEDGLFGYIPDALSRFEARGIGDLDALIRQLDATIARFGGEGIESQNMSLEAELENVKSRVEDWSGAAATNFETYFINAFGVASSTQKYAIQELRAGVESMKSIKTKTQENAKNIADETLVALVNNPGSSGGWEVMLSVVGAALAIASAATIQPEGVAVAMMLLTAAQQAATVGSSMANATVANSSDDVYGIIDSMNSGLTELEVQTRQEVADLSRYLRQSANLIEATVRSHDENVRYGILPSRPSLADEVPNSSDFTPPGR